MSTCTGAPATQFAEQYVTGILAEAEAIRFEDHFFECPICLKQVEAVQAMSAVVSREPVIRPKSAFERLVPVGGFAALAAVLLLGFVGFRLWRHSAASTGTATQASANAVQPQTSEQKAGAAAQADLAQLADLKLPPFRGSTLRDETEDAGFERGMQAYATGDCPAAMEALSEVRAGSKRLLAAQFYTAACHMKSGDFVLAGREFEAIERTGEPTLQEAARYYLVQTALARNNAGRARRELERLVALHGDYEQRARRQLQAVVARQRGKANQ